VITWYENVVSLLGITNEDYLHFRLTQETLRKLFINPYPANVENIPNNASKRQMGFNSAFKGLMQRKA